MTSLMSTLPTVPIHRPVYKFTYELGTTLSIQNSQLGPNDVHCREIPLITYILPINLPATVILVLACSGVHSFFEDCHIIYMSPVDSCWLACNRSIEPFSNLQFNCKWGCMNVMHDYSMCVNLYATWHIAVYYSVQV